MPGEIIPFRIDVPDAELADLRERLRRTRWPEPETAAGWSQGVPLAYLQDLCGYWADSYDWRACQARLNALPQYRTEIDGLAIHFLHVRSPHPGALPLIITHGWPGSVVEFGKVIGPLADPPAYGGDLAAVLTRDELLDNLMLYWLPGTGASAARLYWESIRQHPRGARLGPPRNRRLTAARR
jgi:hypothetical protein